MMPTINRLDELADKLDAGAACSREDAALLLSSHDLVRIGVLGEAARRRVTGNDVSFGRVCVIDGPELPATKGAAGEVRLSGIPASVDEARTRVRTAVAFADGVVLTGYSLADLAELAGHDHLVLAELARALRADGLHAVAETPIDRIGPADLACEVIRAVQHGGLAVWRLTVDRAPLADRLDLVMRAVEIQREVGGVQAFAPLPRLDPAELPSTGYDDVRTIAVARLVCQSIPRIQVDWPLYGPKLAQVAIAYGANDIDGVAPVDAPELGPRRAAAEDIARQIRAASGVPVERDGRYQPRA